MFRDLVRSVDGEPLVHSSHPHLARSDPREPTVLEPVAEIEIPGWFAMLQSSARRHSGDVMILGWTAAFVFGAGEAGLALMHVR